MVNVANNSPARLSLLLHLGCGLGISGLIWSSAHYEVSLREEPELPGDLISPPVVDTEFGQFVES